MNISRTIRVLAFSCLSIIPMVGLKQCGNPYVYKETGSELSMTKSAYPSTVSQAGQVITYNYFIKNNIDPSNNVSGMTIVVTDSPLDGPVVCSPSVVKKNDFTSCTATYTVTEADIANGGVTNNATVNGSFTSFDCVGNNLSCDEGTVEHKATAKASATVTVSSELSPTLPILSGVVTYCDPVQHVINLPFVNGFDPKNFQHQVTMNGVVVNCMVNLSNSKLLECSLPVPVVFPVVIQVAINGNVVNDFSFNGIGCSLPNPQNKPEGGSPACVPSPGSVCP